ncbi:MAG: galactokinase family protein [Bacillota bacterium]|nr:galactokinase family protein [Bacillota bacterium]
MPLPIRVSTPSRLCLFGEHQDYLGLEVVAVAINLRFYAAVQDRRDRLIAIAIRDSKLDRLDSVNDGGQYEYLTIDLDQPILYASKRDYLRSSVHVLQKNGYTLHGMDIRLDSEIPIGKGMCSSSTMIVVLIKALLTCIGHPDQDDPLKIAELAFQAEVSEFDEPGGRMDHYTSAVGGMVHLDFSGSFQIESLETGLAGSFVLFDSLEQKDTTRVLAASKLPTQAALKQLSHLGITSIRDFFGPDGILADRLDKLDNLDALHRRKLMANIENFRILRQGLTLLKASPVDPTALGTLISAHHAQLRDGLGISTPAIEKLLDMAMENGAWGGKVNGSGGGGCCFAYTDPVLAGQIIAASEQMGYPARLLQPDSGVRRCI